MQAAVERFAGVLTLVAIAVAVGTLIALVRGRVPDGFRDEVALPLATAIATVATLGSLWMSEVAGYPPCTLCWYQRIAIYPLVIVTGVAALRRDHQVWRTAVPLAVAGGAVSIWHLVVERNPALGGACDPTAPCSVLWVQEFGVLTLPAMALATVTAIAVLTLAARRPTSTGGSDDPVVPPPTDEARPTADAHR